MAIPAGVSRFVLSGTLPSGEIWQSGFWTNGSFATEGDANTAAATEASNCTTDFATHFSTYQGTGCALTGVTVYSYPAGGPTATIIGRATVTGVAGVLSTHAPNQCSLVATLRTGLSGRRNRGRMYWPLSSAANVGANGQVANAQCTSLANALATHLSRFVSADVVVLSQVATSTHTVTSVTVDSRPDIQRRRADRITSAFTASAAVT